jgi:hypothetical protein
MTETKQNLMQTPADILNYQLELVRTGKYEMIGRIMKLSIGDSARFKKPVDDKQFEQFGRFIDFRHCMLPIGLSFDSSQLLVLAPLLRVSCPKCAERGQTTQFLSAGASTVICPQCMTSFSQAPEVKLPDVPDPFWQPEKFTQDEIEGRAPRDPKKIFPRMLPQYLANRCEKQGTQPALLEGTDYMMFQPVVRMAFQATVRDPKTGSPLAIAAAGLINCLPNEEGKESCFLVNYRTGECHFFGGKYVIQVKQ